jgi:hypothetical protein
MPLIRYEINFELWFWLIKCFTGYNLAYFNQESEAECSTADSMSSILMHIIQSCTEQEYFAEKSCTSYTGNRDEYFMWLSVHHIHQEHIFQFLAAADKYWLTHDWSFLPTYPSKLS